MDSHTGTPEKSYYKNSEVCSMTGVKPYVLRFWENEFPQLDPVTSSSGHKLYEWTHIQIVKKIKELLFDQKMTVDTAKVFLQEFIDEEQAQAVEAAYTEAVAAKAVNPGLELAAETMSEQRANQEDRWRLCANQVNKELTELLELIQRIQPRA